MRKHVALAACVALPFATAVVASVVTPGYALAGHTTTLLVSILVGFAALASISLNMRDDPMRDAGWALAAGWTLSVSLLLTIMLETVILKPGGVDNRQWLPTVALAAIAVVGLCEPEGRRPDREMLLRATALASMILGTVLATALAMSAAAGRLSGEDLHTIGITALFSPLMVGAMIQTQRANKTARAWMGATTLAFVFAVVVMSAGTYKWSAHYSAEALGREAF